MTVWQAMARIEALGYSLRLDESGRVAARIAGSEPEEAEVLFQIASTDRIAAADYVRMRQEGTSVVDAGQNMSLLDALAIGQAIRKHEAEMMGTVRLMTADMSVCLWWYPINGETASSLLERHREALVTAIQRRLEKMDNSEWWNLSPTEYDAFCQKYGFLCWLIGKQEGRHGIDTLEEAR
ncbi:MAG: hypothetical protein IKC28_04370 [Clostridia bacterium]|nr:hypothetical protein [Clostridia bacterium]